MNTTEYYPYRTAEARERCVRYLDGLATRQWPIVSEERMVPTAFGTTFVRVSGPPAAPVLVLLHGAGTTSLMWSPNIDALSKEYRTVAVDQIGEFGKSVCVKPIRTLQDLIVWLDELIRAYSAEKAVRRLQRVAPQVTTQIIPGAGHDLTVMQAATVNESMLRFLRQERAPSKAPEVCAVETGSIRSE